MAIQLKWAVGITTVPSRRSSLLPRTLASLQEAGFGTGRLFVDGARGATDYEYDRLGLEITVRYPAIRSYGNWLLSLLELYVRQPDADRYAMFQDDLVTYANLRQYLESWYPDRGYLNLYTFPSNQALAPRNTDHSQKVGWYESNQLGRGAVGLVFNRDAVRVLLTNQSSETLTTDHQPSPAGPSIFPPGRTPDTPPPVGKETAVAHMIDKPMDCHRGWRSIDGAVVTAMQKAGWREYVHYPSLTQHTGAVSSMGNKPHLLATSFRGEGFDALSLLREKI